MSEKWQPAVLVNAHADWGPCNADWMALVGKRIKVRALPIGDGAERMYRPFGCTGRVFEIHGHKPDYPMDRFVACEHELLTD